MVSGESGWIAILAGALCGAGCFYLFEQCHILPKRMWWRILALLTGAAYGGICIGHAPCLASALCDILFGTVLTIGAVIDKQHLILPDEGAMLLLIFGMLRYAWVPGEAVVLAVQVLVIGGLSYGLRVISHQGFGWGDVKWLTTLALWFHPVGLWCMVTLAFLMGALYGMACRYVWHQPSRFLPFGPFLSLASVGVYFWEDVLRAWM